MDLLEREQTLGQLHRLLVRANEGRGSLVFIGGEAGIGKTALIRQFSAALPAGSRALVGLCDPLSTPRPLGPLLDVAPDLDLDGELDRLLASDAPRHLVFRAVLEALTASASPTLLIIEDAHWADEATLDLLRYLGRRLGASRTLILVTYRDDEVGAPHPLRLVLGDLATADIRRVALLPLSEAAVRILAADSELDPVELHHRTGGNPFFVTEVLAAGARGIPPTVRDAVLARVARM